MMLAYNQCFPERQVKGAVFPLIERKPRQLRQAYPARVRGTQVDTVDTLSTSSNSLNRLHFCRFHRERRQNATRENKIPAPGQATSTK
ncbi:hypothetical protein ACQKOE_00770 [Novosphingobium sp. NPDC080210]|uniref:hypothetical protein n=1 Tax=Novosphingobium sp. NPDC080210 TaxID=3390596 RepID=UPI003D061BEB